MSSASVVVNITDLRYDISREVLNDLFARYGHVIGLEVSPPTPASNKAGGGGGNGVTLKAVVQYNHTQAAQKAIADLHGRQLFPGCCHLSLQLLPAAPAPRPVAPPAPISAPVLSSGGAYMQPQVAPQPTGVVVAPQMYYMHPAPPGAAGMAPAAPHMAGYATPTPYFGGSPYPDPQQQQPPPMMMNPSQPQGGYGGYLPPTGPAGGAPYFQGGGGMGMMAPPHPHHQHHHHQDGHFMHEGHHPQHMGGDATMMMMMNGGGRGGGRGGRGAGFNDFYGGRGGRGGPFPGGRGAGPHHNGGPVMGGPTPMMGGGPGGATPGGRSDRIWLEIFNVPESMTLFHLFTLLEVYGNVAGIRREPSERGMRHLAQFFQQEEGMLAMRSLGGVAVGGHTLRVSATLSPSDDPAAVHFATSGDPKDPQCDSYDFRTTPHRTKLSSQFSSGLKSPPTMNLFVAGLHASVTDEALNKFFSDLGYPVLDLRRKGASTAILKFASVSDAVFALVLSHGKQIVDAYLRVMFSVFDTTTTPGQHAQE